MRKLKVISLIICLTMLCSMLPAAAAPISVTVNDEKQTYTTDVVYANDNIMIPLRDMAESLNYIVEWNGEKQCVDLIKIDKVVTVYVNSNIYEKDGVQGTLPASTVIYGNKTYAPLSFFKAIAPMGVNWDYAKMALAIESDAFPKAEGLFADAPVDPADMRAPYKQTFTDVTDLNKFEIASDTSKATYGGKSQYGTGWYTNRDVLKNIDGEDVFSCHNFWFKYQDFFKDFNGKKWRIRFKVKNDPTNTVVANASSALSFTVKDTGTNGNVLTKYSAIKLAGLDSWTTVEYVLDAPEDRSKVVPADGVDKDSILFTFYTDGTPGIRVLIDDFEVELLY